MHFISHFQRSLRFSEGRTTINVIDPAFEGKVRAKVAEMFPFMKPEDVSAHYKMIEQVLEDEKMVSECKPVFTSLSAFLTIITIKEGAICVYFSSSVIFCFCVL